jgi:Flp pilus assembly protein TadD
VLEGIGRALLLGKEPREAVRAFERVAQLLPSSAKAEEDLGVAYVESGQVENGAAHLRRALELDPLSLSAAGALEQLYRKQGDVEKADAVAAEIRRAIRGSL